MFNKKLQLLILFSLCSSAFAGYPKKCPTPKELAQTLLKMEFHGRRSHQHSSCLKKVKDKAIWVRPEQNDEGLTKPNKIFAWLEDYSSVKIISVKETDYPERYEVKFTYKLGGIAAQEDKMIIETFEGNTKKLAGCAEIVTPPKDLVLVKACKK